MALVLPFHSENEVHCDIVRDYAERPSGDYGEPGKWLQTMGNRLGDGIHQGKGLWGIGNLKYGTTLFGCQSHVAHALWGVGIPTLPINFMPQILYGQLLLRQAGIYASPILINR